jgi:starch-binding outer membrane protein, SusD/RagB family
MNKLISKYIPILAAGLFCFSACTKSFVDKLPLASLTPADALDTSTTLQSALYGLYAELRGTDQYGRDWPVIGDLMADNTFLEQDNSGRYIVQFANQIPITDGVTLSMWSNSYNGILDANNIIDAPAKGADDIKAQAYALRALIYFKIVNIWGQPYTVDSSAPGVPLVLHYNVELLPGRASVGTVYNQIISDLKAAFQNTPDYSSSVYLSKYAVEGLLARVYMYMGDYTDALTAAQDVINNGPFTLVDSKSFAGYWANPGVQSNAVETMFEEDEDAINNNGFDDLGGIYINGYQDLYCSADLAALYTATDVRGGLLISGSTKAGAPAFLVNKYPNAEQSDRDNPKVIRLSEVYLIAAEAENRLSDDGDATTYVNTIAETRDPAFTGYTDVGAALLADIVQERRKELAFEGDRLFDLNRLGLPIVRSSNPGATVGDGITIPFPSDTRVAPIPQGEILRNPALAQQQNPGY